MAGDHHQGSIGEQLQNGQGDVTGASGEVEQKEVELAPGGLLDELGEGLVQHRAAPDDRLTLIDEEAERHQADTIGPELGSVAVQGHGGARPKSCGIE